MMYKMVNNKVAIDSDKYFKHHQEVQEQQNPIPIAIRYHQPQRITEKGRSSVIQ